jgi:hypothetical protein
MILSLFSCNGLRNKDPFSGKWIATKVAFFYQDYDSVNAPKIVSKELDNWQNTGAYKDGEQRKIDSSYLIASMALVCDKLYKSQLIFGEEQSVIQKITTTVSLVENFPSKKENQSEFHGTYNRTKDDKLIVQFDSLMTKDEFLIESLEKETLILTNTIDLASSQASGMNLIVTVTYARQ